jgi:hypothetical protein
MDSARSETNIILWIFLCLKAVRLLLSGILVLVLLLMMIDYINDCACVRSLDIDVQIKIMGESSLVFSGL